jgi:hypothetical protein
MFFVSFMNRLSELAAMKSSINGHAHITISSSKDVFGVIAYDRRLAMTSESIHEVTIHQRPVIIFD